MHNICDMCLMHDASHRTFSEFKWLNQFAAKTLDICGASSAVWFSEHVQAHHVMTALHECDPDFQLVYPIIRSHHKQKRYWFHKYQHIYIWILYINLIIGLFFGFIIFTIRNCIGFPFQLRHIDVSAISNNIFTKTDMIWESLGKFFILFTLITMFTKFNIWHAMFLYLCLFGTLSLLLISQFGIGHVVNNTSNERFTVKMQKYHFENIDEWMHHQIEQSANFNSKNKWIGILTGGINTQIEHHLFPFINSRHYHKLGDIVRKYCEDHHVMYNHQSWLEQIYSHFSYLKILGHSN